MQCRVAGVRFRRSGRAAEEMETAGRVGEAGACLAPTAAVASSLRLLLREVKEQEKGEESLRADADGVSLLGN
jgi:hypothetical protein